MLKKIYFVSFCYILFCGAVFAGEGDSYQFISNWGGPAVEHPACITANNIPTTACIGASAEDDCSPKSYKSLVMMLARSIDENCATFCPTQVRSVNGGEYTVRVDYSEAQRGADDCVTLCQNPTKSDGRCESQLLQQSNYATMTNASGMVGSIKDYIAKFYLNGSDCVNGGTVSYFNDTNVVLAIVDYLQNGHGAYVQRVIVKSARMYDVSDRYKYYPYVVTVPNTSRVLVCRLGYKPSEKKDDCVPATPQCGEQSESSCKPVKDGVTTDGVCVHCPTGEIFDNRTTSCSLAQKLTAQELQYGKGQTSQTIKNLQLNDQCWTKDITDDYYECVLHREYNYIEESNGNAGGNGNAGAQMASFR